MTGVTSLEEITFELAREGLRDQAHDVDTLRSRAGTLLAVAIAAGGLLAEPAVRDASGLPLWLALTGLAAAVTAIGSALTVIRARPLGFTADVVRLYEIAVEDGDAGRHYLRLAVTLRERTRTNEPLVTRLHGRFGLSTVSLAMEIVALTAAIGVR